MQRQVREWFTTMNQPRAFTTTVFNSQRASFASPIFLLATGLVLTHWMKE